MRARWDRPAPGEERARERAWTVVSGAFAERERLPRGRSFRPGALVVLAGLAAAALGTAGAAVLEATRGAPHARRALSAVPGGGRLLVEAGGATWVVRADGSKRRLGSYADPTWSPHGKYVAAVRGHELYALTPEGDIRWTLARRGRVRLPSWNGPDGFRVAYLAGENLRVVAGNGEGDRRLAHGVPAVRPAWKPGPAHILAYADGKGVRVVQADTGRPLWRAALRSPVTGLAWSDDGRRLLVDQRGALRVLDAAGRPVLAESRGAVAAVFMPHAHRIAVVRPRGASSAVTLVGRSRALFEGAGAFDSLAWSPDGRWLVVAWPSADQLLFMRSAAVRNVRAFSGVASTFGSAPRIAGWSVSSPAS